MRKIRAGCGLLVVMAACSGPEQEQHVGHDETMERAAVERTVTDWQSAVGRMDTALVARLVTPTFQILQDSIWYDREGWLTLVTSLPDLMGGPFEISYTFSDWRTTVKGDVAWTTVRNHAKILPGTGDPIPVDWRETAVLQKEGDRWRIDRYHSATLR